MAKLQMKDLTPEVLAEVEKLSEPKEVVDYFKAKDLEVSEQTAATILEQVHSDGERMSDEELGKVAGGKCGGGGRTNS